METKYPSWFNANYNNKCYNKPEPPPKTVIKYNEIGEITADQYTWADISSLPESTDCISVKVDRDYYDNSIYGVKIIFGRKEIIPNPQYKKQLKDYEQRRKEYEVGEKEWNHWKKIWDEEQPNIDKEKRRKEYEKLKKEFGNG